MIRHWFTRDDAPLTKGFAKRFDPRHFTVDFPRGAIASAVLGPKPASLIVTAEFLRRNDLVGLIYSSDDSKMHPVNRRELNRDFRRCRLSFRWQSNGLPGLDSINGPTLTIEGRDATGVARTWYVRLWNYASGTPTDAVIQLDFDQLSGGFNLSADADPVEPSNIDRMFFSIVSESFNPDDDTAFDEPRSATLEISDIVADGSGSVLSVNDAMVPAHRLRMCTAYDDLYNLVPERVIEVIERLGYRDLINHYIGMSHHQRLSKTGLVDPTQPLNAAAAAWHRAFAKAAKEAGFELIFSLSFEIIASACPATWMQRTASGEPALTGYTPPSALVSPANPEAVDYLARTGVAFAQVAHEAGLRPRIQIGEAWWWITSDQRPCLYDAAAVRVFGGQPTIIEDVRGPKSPAEENLLDQAGLVLAAATKAITSAVREAFADAETLLLVYTPTILSAESPELYRANLPAAWARPAFDVLQVEDYEWLTLGRLAAAESAKAVLSERLRYPLDEQHYFAGFAAAPQDWRQIVSSAESALESGAGEVFLWALPQILRDKLTIFEAGGSAMNAFEDVLFPLEIGASARVVPGFSTTVLTSASGHEYRNANWSQGRLRFDAGPGVRSDDEIKQLISFFRARRGSAQAFRFRDPYDHSSRDMTQAPTMIDLVIGEGDGMTTSFPLFKNYGDGERRRITQPVLGSIIVAVDGTEQVANWRTAPLGLVVFDEPPASGSKVTAGFYFDVPVRFESDDLTINRSTFMAGEAPRVPLVEVREGSL